MEKEDECEEDILDDPYHVDGVFRPRAAECCRFAGLCCVGGQCWKGGHSFPGKALGDLNTGRGLSGCYPMTEWFSTNEAEVGPIYHVIMIVTVRALQYSHGVPT